MRASLKLALFLHLLSFSAVAQEKTDSVRFLDGRLFRDHDTLTCKIIYGKEYVIGKTVTVVYDKDTIDIPAGSSVHGFSFFLDSMRHYGSVNAKTPAGKRSFFVKKTLTGKIDFYVYAYVIFKTIKGAPRSTTEEHYTDYYISKNDPLHPELAIPKPLPSLTRKKLEPYLNDNPNIMNRLGNRLKKDELLAIIKEYNIESK